MYVVYTTGQYIAAPNDDGGLCESLTFQQASKSLQFIHHHRLHSTESQRLEVDSFLLCQSWTTANLHVHMPTISFMRAACSIEMLCKNGRDCAHDVLCLGVIAECWLLEALIE